MRKMSNAPLVGWREGTYKSLYPALTPGERGYCWRTAQHRPGALTVKAHILFPVPLDHPRFLPTGEFCLRIA
jgi:hypothetical protein